MRTLSAALSVVLTLGLLIAGVPASADAPCERPLRVGHEDWPPYEMPRDDGLYGINGKILRAIADQLGCRIVWRERPWQRILDGLKRGSIDVTGTATIKADRQGFVRYSEPYTQFVAELFVGDRIDEDYDSLRAFLDDGHDVAVVNGYSYGGSADGLLQNEAYSSQIFRMYAASDAVRAVAAGRIAALIGNRRAVPYMARSQGVEARISRTGVVVQDEPAAFMFSRETVSVSLLARVNEAIAILRRDGIIDRITEEYSLRVSSR